MALALASCDLGSHEVEDAGPGPNTQSSTACSSVCHGSEGVAAPPRDTSGRTSALELAVASAGAGTSASNASSLFMEPPGA